MTIDNPKSDVILSSSDILSTDSTLKLSKPEEKLLKRLRQVGCGLFHVVVLDGKLGLEVGGKVEILG